MIHLFGKVYLTYAELSVGPENLDRMSEHYIQIIDKDLVDIKFEIFNKNRITYVKYLDQLLNEFPSNSQLLELLDQTIKEKKSPKIYIYCDETAMLQFLVMWWKGLFPRLTADGAYAIYLNFSDYETIRSHPEGQYLNIGVNDQKIAFHEFSELYWGKTKEEFTAYFHKYDGFCIPSSIREQCSLEYKIIDYIINTESIFGPSLIKTLSEIYIKKFMNELTGIMRMVERNLFFLADEYQSLKEGAKLDQKSIKEFIQKDKRFKFLIDNQVKNSRSSYDYLANNYDLKELATILLDLDYIYNKKFGLDLNGVKLDNPCLYYLKTHGTHPKISDILEKEIDGTSSFTLFKDLTQKSKFNPYIIPAFKRLSQTSSKFSQEFRLC